MLPLAALDGPALASLRSPTATPQPLRAARAPSPIRQFSAPYERGRRAAAEPQMAGYYHSSGALTTASMVRSRSSSDSPKLPAEATMTWSATPS